MQKNKSISDDLIFFCLISVLFLTNYGSTVYAQDARELVYQNRLQANLVKTGYSKVKMKTCKYHVKNKKIRCIEKPRVKVFESIYKNYSDIGKNGKQDQKAINIILSPKSEKGIGMLNYSYQSDDKDDDSWMYFSSLGKVRRITSSNKIQNEPASGSLFGSEFSSEDISGTPIDDYEYKILKSIQYKGNHTWVIEQTPKPQRLRKSHYSKTVFWLDQTKKIIPKWVTYNRQGKPFKLFTKDRWKQIDGVWIAEVGSVRNLITRRKTTFITLQEHLNIPVDNENYFTQRVLTDGVFQNRLFNKMHQLFH